MATGMTATAAQAELGDGDGDGDGESARSLAGAASMAVATACAGAARLRLHPAIWGRDGQRRWSRCAGVEVEAAEEAAVVPEMIRGRADRPKLVDSCGCWRASGDACDCGPYLRQRAKKKKKKRLISTQANGSS